MRQGWKQVALAIAVVAGTGGHDAAAAIRFPYAGGVPGESGSGPPDWWSATAGLTGTDTTTYADDRVGMARLPTSGTPRKSSGFWSSATGARTTW